MSLTLFSLSFTKMDYHYLFNAAPYILTLLIMIATCSPQQTLAGSPGALGKED